MIRSWVYALTIASILMGSSGWLYQQLQTENWTQITGFIQQFMALSESNQTSHDPLTSPSLVLGTTLEVVDAKWSIATVSGIVDGDTITLSTGQKVRYIGIDTPEIHHPAKGKQCFGNEAKQRNSELVLGKTVRLEKDVNETDRYGRLLRYVWLGNELINQKLVADGFAHAASYPPDIARQTDLRQAEQEARQQRLGLWQSCPATPTP